MPADSDLPPRANSDVSFSASAAEIVLRVTPLEDSGANTADRYDWQAAMAAADGLALYLRMLGDDGALPADCEARILCEWQEDWVLLDGGGAELVSCKHRDPAAGAFTTVNKLADEGGLAHLFNRWCALEEKPLCRLVTTGGIGAGDPQTLEAASHHMRGLRVAGESATADDEMREIVDKLRKAIATYCLDTKTRWGGDGGGLVVPHVEQCGEVARFLSMLRLDYGRPQRAHVEHAAPSMFAQPVLDRLGSPGSAEAVWEAVIRLFRARMRAKGPVPGGALPKVMAYLPGAPAPAHQDVDDDVLARIVTMGDIETAITNALAMPAGYEPVARVPLTTRLAVKLNVGGCSDNSAERAERLRRDYLDFWRDRASGEAAARVEQRRFEHRLLRISDEATQHGAPSGAALWRRLQDRMDVLSEGDLPAGMDADLALGGLCDLANECAVWFGPRFDVEAVIERLRGEREVDR